MRYLFVSVAIVVLLVIEFLQVVVFVIAPRSSPAFFFPSIDSKQIEAISEGVPQPTDFACVSNAIDEKEVDRVRSLVSTLDRLFGQIM